MTERPRASRSQLSTVWLPLVSRSPDIDGAARSTHWQQNSQPAGFRAFMPSTSHEEDMIFSSAMAACAMDLNTSPKPITARGFSLEFSQVLIYSMSQTPRTTAIAHG